MKPFLLLATRAEDEAADGEYAAFLEGAELDTSDLVRVRLEAGPLPEIRLDDFSGVIVGGSPFNASDDDAVKSDVQRRVEGELAALLDRVIEHDYPFLGACYGIGLLGTHLGGVVDRTYTEPIGPVRVRLTTGGAADPLFVGMDPEFDAFVGHKEACSVLPSGAVLLASSATCPVQAFRVGENVYATQFHPELTVDGILTRIRVYRGYGYFAEDEMDALVASVRAARVTQPARLLRAFVARYAADADGKPRRPEVMPPR
ncbi:glutamine amidotransferase [Planctomonas psychrotolerans]|uniref:glutamine amidotransferase n=1 Tax=Planctomonas psychrotolerans TaxID=2528712 RepID=UPI00123B63F2|nr:glutamine amidotransferase [Planctomonas psychrotolerans]